MKALVIGATGLVGTQLVNQLLKNNIYTEIILFVRKKTAINHQKLTQLEIDFNHLENEVSLIKGDVLFSCMGTTIKKAKTKENQYLIDYTYQYNFAKIAADNNIKKYILISSLGANKNAKTFYSKMKGELEEAIKKLPFQNIYILQPSLLLGNRKEFRLGEKIAIQVFKILNIFIPKKYKGIEAKKVAESMIKYSLITNNKKINMIKNNLML